MQKTNRLNMIKHAMALLALMLVSAYCLAAPKPIKLKDGINDIHVNGTLVRLVKGYVTYINGGYNYFTFTAFVIPKDSSSWIQILFEKNNASPTTYTSNEESADSNLTDTFFYKKSGNIFMVQGKKLGKRTSKLFTSRAIVKITTYKLYGDEISPTFLEVGSKITTRKYMDASDAVMTEIFGG